MHYVVADAAHDGTSHLAQTTRSHNDHRYVLLLGHLTDYLARLVASFRSHPSRYLEIIITPLQKYL